MKIKDTLIIKNGDEVIKEFVYLASTGTQHLFSDESGWVGEIGTTLFLPVKKENDYKQIDDNTWELNVEPIKSEDL